MNPEAQFLKMKSTQPAPSPALRLRRNIVATLHGPREAHNQQSEHIPPRVHPRTIIRSNTTTPTNSSYPAQGSQQRVHARRHNVYHRSI